MGNACQELGTAPNTELSVQNVTLVVKTAVVTTLGPRFLVI